MKLLEACSRQRLIHSMPEQLESTGTATSIELTWMAIVTFARGSRRLPSASKSAQNLLDSSVSAMNSFVSLQNMKHVSTVWRGLLHSSCTVLSQTHLRALALSVKTSGLSSTISRKAGRSSRKRFTTACTDVNLVATGITTAWKVRPLALHAAFSSAVACCPSLEQDPQHNRYLTKLCATTCKGVSREGSHVAYLKNCAHFVTVFTSSVA